MGLKVIEEGLQTSIQDSGRRGFQSVGFTVTGAMDGWAMQLANIVVNNDPEEAVLEMSYVGPTLTFEQDMIIALAGADMSAKVNGKPADLGKPIAVTAGETLQMRTAKIGLHCYLAVKGGFQIPDLLGSKSACMKDILDDDYKGKLTGGDIIPIRQPEKSEPFNWRLSSGLFDYLHAETVEVRYLEGRQYGWFSEESIKTFSSQPYKPTPQSNRMGYRLTGPVLTTQRKQDLITEATQFGTIQVPPSGQPIILMAESQPSGGYPKIGQVIQADLPKLSQLRPGQPVVFKKTSLEVAYQQMKEKQQELLAIQRSTQLKWNNYTGTSNLT